MACGPPRSRRWRARSPGAGSSPSHGSGRRWSTGAGRCSGRRPSGGRTGPEPAAWRCGLLFLWLVFLVTTAVVAVVEQRWGDLVRGLFFVAALVLPPLVFRRNLRRAVERNQDQPATA